MEQKSLQLVQNLILEDLKKLENSNLKQANKTKYDEFKTKYDELSQKLLTYQVKRNIEGITLNPNTIYSLKNDYARLSASFDFYMSVLGGYTEIAQYQTKKIAGIIENISKKLTKEIYLEIEQELNESLELYQEILKSNVKTAEMQNIILKVKYEIYKYKIEEFVYSDDINLEEFIPLVLEDINVLLNDNNLNEFIREELTKYSLDSKLILSNFNTIIILINLGLSKRNISKEELSKELNKVLYKESDLKKEYEKPSSELIEKVKNIHEKNKRKLEDSFEYIFCYEKEFAKEMIAELCFNDDAGFFGCFFVDSDIIQIFNNNNFKDIKYLAEGLIKGNGWRKGYNLTSLAFSFKEYDYDCSYDIACAVIAHKEEMLADDLVTYIIDTNNEFLINYILRSNNKEYFTNELIGYAIDTNNKKLLEYLDNNKDSDIVFRYLIILIKKDKDFSKVLDIYISLDNITDEEKKNFLIDNCRKNPNSIIINKLAQYQDIDLFLSIFDKGVNIHSYYEILNSISNPVFKKKVYDKIYSIIDSIYENEDLTYNQKQNNIHFKFADGGMYSLKKSKVLYPFRAYLYSKEYVSNANPEDIEFLIDKYFDCKLDWANIIDYVNRCFNSEARNRVFRKLYLSKKEVLFNNNPTITYEFALEMVNEVPESINDFLEHMKDDDIPNLAKEPLDIFCKYYQEKLETEGCSLSDKVNNVLDGSIVMKKQAKELLTYIMHKGLINSEILSRYSTMYYNLIIKAILNSKDKYLRVTHLNVIRDKHTYFDAYNYYLLSSKELEEIENDNKVDKEVIDLRLRKYYWDLIKLLNDVNNVIKERIVIYIAKSGLREHINYIKTNYPEYINIMIENTEDISLNSELMIAYENFISSPGKK